MLASITELDGQVTAPPRLHACAMLRMRATLHCAVLDPYSKVYVYKYKGTIPANEAKKSDFSFSPTRVPTDDILRPATKVMVQVHVDIVCVPKVALIQAAKEGAKEGSKHHEYFLPKKTQIWSTAVFLRIIFTQWKTWLQHSV